MAFFFFSGEPGDVLYPNLNTIRIIVQIPSTKRCQIQNLRAKFLVEKKGPKLFLSIHSPCLKSNSVWKLGFSEKTLKNKIYLFINPRPSSLKQISLFIKLKSHSQIHVLFFDPHFQEIAQLVLAFLQYKLSHFHCQ